jgi:DNA uptake protein ComE-like DNA-binding protein
MPTPSENKALAFVAIVALLAGAVRVVRAGGIATPDPTPVQQQAIARQAYAADSASSSQKAAKGAKKASNTTIKVRVAPRKLDAGVQEVAGVASVPALPAALVDLDTATVEQLQALPRIGPALAKRLVANRDSLGPFRSMAGLKRVKGLGPVTLSRLAPLVTFSGQTRP